MPTQSIRISICRTPKEVQDAKDRDVVMGYGTVVSEGNDVKTNIARLIDTLNNGDVRDLAVQVDANDTAQPPLTILITKK